jgi:hypothetical protein
VAGAAPARSAGSVNDAAAVTQKGGAAFGRFGGPMVLVGAGLESSSRVFYALVQIKESISYLSLLQRVQSGGRSRSNSNPQCHGRSCSRSAHRCGDLMPTR